MIGKKLALLALGALGLIKANHINETDINVQVQIILEQYVSYKTHVIDLF